MAWFYCFLDQMYHLAGECLKVFVFIRRGMHRNIFTRRTFMTEARGIGQSISLKLVQNRIYIFAFFYLLDCIIWTGHYFCFEFYQSCFVLFVLCVYVVCTFYSVQLADTFYRATVVEPRDRGVPNTFPSVNKIHQQQSLFANQS